MDPLSQAFFGAAAATAISKKTELKKAFCCGIIAGLAADLDIFIKSNTDPLLGLEFHRHFTHSLFFIPFAALLVAAFCFLFYRKDYKKLYLYSFVAYATHGFLDSCTSYGTMWLWPFYTSRIAFDNISIIDPLFTLPIIILTVFAVIKVKPKIAKYALIYAFCYLALGYLQKLRVENFITNIAKEKQQVIEALKLNPTLGNIVLWRSVYEVEGKYYVNAVRQPLFGEARIYQGTVIPKLNLNELLGNMPSDSKLTNDILRFHHFSQGFIYYNNQQKNIIADLRYGTLPNNLDSLWGIEINRAQPDQHAKYLFLRNFNKDKINIFKKMLLNKKL